MASVSVGAAPAANLTPGSVTASHGHSGSSVRKKKKPEAGAKHRLCSAIVSLGAVQMATGMGGTALVSANADKFNWETSPGVGEIPGSECLYDDVTPNTSYTQTVFGVPDVGDDYVTVGYGEPEANWRALEARAKANGGVEQPGSADVPTSSIDGNAPVSALALGHGSQAYLMTGNLVAAGDAEPNTRFPSPGPLFPTVYYIVTVRTKRHDVLQVGLYNATLAAAEGLVKQVLNSGSF
jgi:hypothetical protein